MLIPAALENQITAANAERVKAKHPGRGRQRPDHARGRRILRRRGIFVIPDILCNAGGVTVSYFEWVQDLNRDHWSEAVVTRSCARSWSAFDETLASPSASRSTSASAPYLLAVDRVASATALRGLYP